MGGLLSGRTLNQRLIFAVCVALAPIALLSITQGMRSYEVGQRLMKERLVSSALATAAVQREPIVEAQRVLEMLARDPAVRDMTATCSDDLRDMLRDNRQIVNYIRSDAAGRVRCSAIPSSEEVSFRGESWWREAINARTFSLSRPTLGQVSKRRVLLALHPLFDNRTGAFEGMVSAGIQLSWIETALQRTTLSKDAVAAIAGTNGEILVAPKPFPVSRVNVAGSFNTAIPAKGADGRQWFYSSAPIYDRALTVVYAEPQNMAAGFTRNNLRADIIFPLLAIIAASIAVWIGVTLAVTQWLHELGKLAHQFARGNHPGDRARFAHAPEEIVALSNDLHDMAAGMEARNADLESAAAANLGLAREVNHRVKNNLQLIISLLGLQARQVRDPAAILALSQTRNRVATLGLIYRLMYDEAQHAEEGHINLRQLFEELCRQLRTNGDIGSNIDLHCEAPDAPCSIDTVIPLSLFVLEAVTNAGTHAYSDGQPGDVLIRLTSDERNFELTITDEGVGFDSNAPTSTMGMELMRAFALQLNGNLSIEALPGEGVTIWLSFPNPDSV
jgi:two-component sensor histidine kinase